MVFPYEVLGSWLLFVCWDNRGGSSRMSLSGVGRHARMNRPSRRSTFCVESWVTSLLGLPPCIQSVSAPEASLLPWLAGCVCGAAYERAREMTGHVECSPGPHQVSVDASEEQPELRSRVQSHRATGLQPTGHSWLSACRLGSRDLVPEQGLGGIERLY